MSSERQVREVGGSLSELFEILSHESRRRILMAVGQNNPQDEDDIILESAGDEQEVDVEILEHVKLQLQHQHLPKLADAGLIDWDSESGTITRGPRFDEIEPLLKLMHDDQDELPDDWP
jgi:hypothetical protein